MIKKFSKARNTLFNLKNLLPLSLIHCLILLLSSCSSIPTTRSEVKDLAIKAALKASQPMLKKIFLDEAPVLPPSQSSLPLVKKLPGGKAFNSNQYQKRSIAYDAIGNLLLEPGDYTIPVMTFCMKLGGTSPPAHIYSLSTLEGSRAAIIRDLNARSLPQFDPSDVQILSWSLQAGLSYEEMSSRSKRIIDEVIPERRKELKESFLERFEKRWDQLAENSHGLIPDFSETSDEILSDLGEVGSTIREIRAFRRSLDDFGNDYSALSRMIDVRKSSTSSNNETLWSKVSSRVYARFITKGNFQQVGLIEIRVLPPSQNRATSSIKSSKLLVDLHALFADPQNILIQPLSFALVLNTRGMLFVSGVAEAPLIATALLSSILAAELIDWDSYFKLTSFLNDVKDPNIRELIQKGNLALKEEHDELEKPAREAGVITGKTKNTSSKESNEVREYTKPGGVEALEKDFEKMPGELIPAKGGIPTKVLPDGTRIVKRIPRNSKEKPTLEIQPPQVNTKTSDRLRIKVRYPI